MSESAILIISNKQEMEIKMAYSLVLNKKSILDLSGVSYTLTADKKLIIFVQEDEIVKIPVINEKPIKKYPNDYKVEYYTRSDGFEYKVINAKDEKQALEIVKEKYPYDFQELYSISIV